MVSIIWILYFLGIREPFQLCTPPKREQILALRIINGSTGKTSNVSWTNTEFWCINRSLALYESNPRSLVHKPDVSSGPPANPGSLVHKPDVSSGPPANPGSLVHKPDVSSGPPVNNEQYLYLSALFTYCCLFDSKTVKNIDGQ